MSYLNALKNLAHATFIMAVLVLLIPLSAQARVPIVATTADLKSLAEAVGGEHVNVVALVPANIDAEEYQPKPHDINRLRDARLVLRVGVDYDLWFDRLLQQAGNPAIVRGGSAYIDCSFGIALLDVRGSQVGPSGGHAHGSGNPHYWLDPANAEMMTAVILEALVRNDAPNAKYYETQRTRFLARVSERLLAWEKTLAFAQGKPLIAYHNTWAYFARRFRLNFVGYVEPRPGVPPSAAQVAALIRLAQSQQVKVIVRQAHEPAKNVDFLASRTGARAVILASSVGAVPQAVDYISLFDYNASAIAAALR